MRVGDPLPSPWSGEADVGGTSWGGGLGGVSRTFQLDVEPLAVAFGGREGTGIDSPRPRAVLWLLILGGSHQQPGGGGSRKEGRGDVEGGSPHPDAPCFTLGVLRDPKET